MQLVRPASWAVALVASSVVFVASTGAAQAPTEPGWRGGAFVQSLVARPLTVPARVVAPRLELSAFRESFRVPGVGRVDLPTLWRTELAVAYGVTDDLEAFVVAPPIVVSPHTDYENLTLGVTYRVIPGVAELAMRLDGTLPIQESTDAEIGASVVGLWHAHASVAVRGAARFVFATGKNAADRLEVPLAVVVRIVDALALAADVAARFGDYEPRQAVVGAGLTGTYSVARAGRPVADVGVSFSFPRFWTPDAATDAIEMHEYRAAFFARGYLGL